MGKLLFWFLNFTKNLFFAPILLKSSSFEPKLLKMFYLLSLNLKKKDIFSAINYRKKNLFFSSLFFYLNYYKNSLQSLNFKDEKITS